MPDKKVICLHVSYPRLVKHGLSKPFIDLLSERFTVKILAPFMITNDDLDYLNIDAHQFVQYDENFNSIQRNLVRGIDYFRRYSYFFRNRSKLGLDTFAQILLSAKYPAILRYIALFFMKIGLDKKVWVILDKFFQRLYTPKIIRELDFQCDLLIQFSNWGINDYVIKNAKFVQKAKKVFFPYTSDQIYATGYFLHRFEKIYCQSQPEYELLSLLHNHEGPAGIAGSLWFRHVDHLINTGEFTPVDLERIVYAGVSSEFFPKASEIDFVNGLQAQFPRYEILYLPYFAPTESQAEIERLLPSISVAFHETAITELGGIEKVVVKDSILKYLAKIAGAKLFVMSYNTSMGIDFSYMNHTKIFSYFFDDLGKVKNGPYSKLERSFFAGPNYHEINLKYQFVSDDFENVAELACHRWDSNVDLSKVVKELATIV